jgi:16S rRNA (guanine527-N7)-methyltransferase
LNAVDRQLKSDLSQADLKIAGLHWIVLEGLYHIVHGMHTVIISGRSIRVPSPAVVRQILGHRILDRQIFPRPNTEPENPSPNLTDTQVNQIQRYIAILLFWNERLNLTSVTDPAEILSRHFGEALLATRLLPAKGRLADVGSGAGFPGLALKIFIRDLQVLLIEQNAKKAAFLNEVIRFLSLPGVAVERVDYRTLNPRMAPFDAITARALGSYRELTNWAVVRLVPAGKLILWLGEEDATKISQLPDWRFDPPSRIPDSRHRILLVGSPTCN